MTGTTNVYYVWYGNWSGNSATTILPDLASHIGGSPYFNINTSYYDAVGTHVVDDVRFAGSTTDNYSQGTALTDASIQAIVSSALTSHRLPTDPNAVYFVLTSSDVSESGGEGTFCGQFCGWHTGATLNGSTIKYSFVGNPDRCPTACEAPDQRATGTSPNGNPGADGMASVVAHELEEAVSDPLLNAWYFDVFPNNENADQCAWTFGSEYHTANGAVANVRFGARDYLIQRNWVNDSGGYCSMSYPSLETTYSAYAIPESRWQAFFNTVTPLGYRISWFEGYDVNGATFFNVVLVKDTSIPWVHQAGMDGATYQATFNNLVGQGFRLQQVASYKSGGNLRYAATFYKQSWPAWTAYNGVTVAQHQTNFNNLTAQGYRLVDQTATDIGGTVFVAALYDKVNVGGWTASMQMTAAQYQTAFTTNANAGRRLAYLDVYVSGGQPLFSAIFDSTAIGSWAGRHNQTALDLQQNQDTFHGQGLRTRLIAGYQSGSTANFGSFWNN